MCMADVMVEEVGCGGLRDGRICDCAWERRRHVLSVSLAKVGAMWMCWVVRVLGSVL